MNKNIIIVILVVIIIAIAAFMFLQPANNNGKANTQIDMVSADSISNGEKIEFVLKDDKGSAIANQPVIIALTQDDGSIENFSVITDSDGKGSLVLEGESAGSHNVKIVYGGNDKYNGCEITKTITVKEGTSDASTADDVNASNSTASSDSSKSSSLHYDAKLGVYYDDNGIIRSGQSDGMKIDDFRKGDPYANIS